MNNMKTIVRITALLLAAAMLLSFAACGGDGSGDTPTESTTSYIREVKTKISNLSGPLGIGIAKLAADRDYAYETTLFSDSEQICELLRSGKTDIAVLPVNVAAKLYNETDGAIKVIAVNSRGVFHILENGGKVMKLEDLKGKTVYALGEGNVPEYLLNEILEKNGLDGKVTVEYKADFNEIKTVAEKDKSAVFMLPEPYASTLKASAEGIRYALDLSDEWEKVSDAPFAQGVVVARAEYIEKNAEYIETFLMQNEISVNYIIENTVAAPELLGNSGSFESVEVASVALIGCNPRFIRGEEMKKAVGGTLDMLYEANPELLGGKMPDDGMYY